MLKIQNQPSVELRLIQIVRCSFKAASRVNVVDLYELLLI